MAEKDKQNLARGTLFLAAGYFAGFVWLMAAGMEGGLAIEVGREPLPIPLYLWLATAAYILLASKLQRSTASGAFRALLLLGFFMHIILTLFDLELQLIQGNLSLNSSIFKSYYYVFFFLLVLLSASWAWAITKGLISWDSGQRRPSNHTHTSPLLLPICGLPIYGAVLFSLRGDIRALFLFAIAFALLIAKERSKDIFERIRLAARSSFSWTARERHFLILFFTLSLGLRLFALYRIVNDGGIETFVEGTRAYLLAAEYFVRWDFFDLNYVAGFWMFLSIFIYLFPGLFPPDFANINYAPSLFFLGAVMALITCIALIFFYYFLKHALNERTAKITIILYSFTLNLIFLTITPYYFVMEVFYHSLIAFLLVAYAAKKSRSTLYAVLLGIIFGLLIATREFDLIFLLPVLLWLLVYLITKRAWRALYVHVPLMLLMILLTLSPFAYRNYKNFGHYWSHPNWKERHDTIPHVGDYYYSFGRFTRAHHYEGATKIDFLKNAVRSMYPPNFFEMELFMDPPLAFGSFGFLHLVRNSRYYSAMSFYIFAIFLVGLAVLIVNIRKNYFIPFILLYLVLRIDVHMLTQSQYRHVPVLYLFMFTLGGAGIYCIIKLLSSGKEGEGSPLRIE